MMVLANFVLNLYCQIFFSLFVNSFSIKTFFQTNFLDYVQAGKTDQFKSEFSYWIPILYQIGLAIYLCELVGYLIFFYFLYNYNKGLQIITQETKKFRNKTNAQTMMVQFYLFVTDTVYIVFLYFAILPGTATVLSDAKDIGSFLKPLEFGILSMVHCLLIPELRNKCFSWIENTLNFKKFKSLFLLHHLKSLLLK
jgi:hypothetical protein